MMRLASMPRLSKPVQRVLVIIAVGALLWLLGRTPQGQKLEESAERLALGDHSFAGESSHRSTRCIPLLGSDMALLRVFAVILVCGRASNSKSIFAVQRYSRAFVLCVCVCVCVRVRVCVCVRVCAYHINQVGGGRSDCTLKGQMLSLGSTRVRRTSH